MAGLRTVDSGAPIVTSPTRDTLAAWGNARTGSEASAAATTARRETIMLDHSPGIDGTGTSYTGNQPGRPQRCGRDRRCNVKRNPHRGDNKQADAERSSRPTYPQRKDRPMKPGYHERRPPRFIQPSLIGLTGPPGSLATQSDRPRRFAAG